MSTIHFSAAALARVAFPLTCPEDAVATLAAVSRVNAAAVRAAYPHREDCRDAQGVSMRDLLAELRAMKGDPRSVGAAARAWENAAALEYNCDGLLAQESALLEAVHGLVVRVGHALAERREQQVAELRRRLYDLDVAAELEPEPEPVLNLSEGTARIGDRVLDLKDGAIGVLRMVHGSGYDPLVTVRMSDGLGRSQRASMFAAVAKETT